MLKYRIAYENYLGTKIGEDFEVHHIDGNRNNNDIENLVAVPKYKHIEYHRFTNKVKNNIEWAFYNTFTNKQLLDNVFMKTVLNVVNTNRIIFFVKQRKMARSLENSFISAKKQQEKYRYMSLNPLSHIKASRPNT